MNNISFCVLPVLVWVVAVVVPGLLASLVVVAVVVVLVAYHVGRLGQLV